MTKKHNKLVNFAIIAAIMIIPTYVLFGPSGGFHHMHGYGVFKYLILEDRVPITQRPGLFDYSISFSQERFIKTIIYWAIILLVVVFVDVG